MVQHFQAALNSYVVQILSWSWWAFHRVCHSWVRCWGWIAKLEDKTEDTARGSVGMGTAGTERGGRGTDTTWVKRMDPKSNQPQNAASEDSRARNTQVGKEHQPRDPGDPSQCTPEEQHVSSLPNFTPPKDTPASSPLNTWMSFQRQERKKEQALWEHEHFFPGETKFYCKEPFKWLGWTTFNLDQIIWFIYLLTS